MNESLAQKILDKNTPFVFYHTYSVTNESIQASIDANTSMDLDVCVDEEGHPYIGHSQEFYKISGEKQEDCLPLWEAVEKIASSTIAVIIDCKHHDAWHVVEEVIEKIGAERCLVHSYISQLHFNYNLYDHDYPTEWSDAEKLKMLKEKFPSVTTTASCKFLPEDFVTNPEYHPVWEQIREILVANNINTVCLNIPDHTISNTVLNFFLEKEILPHLNVDGLDLRSITSVYVGETNIQANASKVDVLR